MALGLLLAANNKSNNSTVVLRPRQLAPAGTDATSFYDVALDLLLTASNKSAQLISSASMSPHATMH